MKRNFVCTEEGSNKFWNIELVDKGYKVTYGKVGSSGTVSEKQFESEEKALVEIDKLIKSKTKKGYTEEGASTDAAPAAAKTAPKAAAKPAEKKVEKAAEAPAAQAEEPQKQPDFKWDVVKVEYSKNEVDMSSYPILSMMAYSRCVGNGKFTNKWSLRKLIGFKQFLADNQNSAGVVDVEGKKVEFTAGGMEDALLEAIADSAEKDTRYKVRITAGDKSYEAEFVLLDVKTVGALKYLEYETIAMYDTGPGVETHLHIPSHINGKPVDTISAAFLQWQRTITNITLPPTLRVIAHDGLSCCALKEIVVPKSVVHIGVGAFDANGDGLESVRFECDVDLLPNEAFKKDKKLKKVEFKSLKKIGVQAFCEAGIEKFSFNGVEEIGENAFTNSGLKSVDLSDSVKKINDFAFFKPIGLTSINIGKNVESIGYAAFIAKDNKEKITVSPENKHFYADSTGLYTKDGELLRATANDGVYVIPDNVKKLSGWSFYDINLKSLTIGAGVEEIGEHAFYRSYGFSDFKLAEIKLSPQNKHFKMVDGCVYTADGKRLIIALDTNETLKIQDGTTHINSCAFHSHNKLAEVTLPDTVEEIGYSSFHQCDALRKVNMSKNIKRIYDMAFYFTQALSEINLHNVEHIGSNVFRHNVFTSVKLGDGIKFIGESAFSQSKRLKSIEIGSGDTEICKEAFEYCDSLQSVHIGGGSKVLKEKCFANNDKLQKVTFDAGTLEIGYEAFYDDEKLTDLTLPSTLVRIGENAFRNTESLKKVAFPDSLERIEKGAFENSGLQNVTLGNNVKWIGTSAFSCAQMTKFHIPANVEYIGEEAIESRQALALTIDAANKHYTLKNGMLMDMAETIFIKYIGKDSKVTLPATIKRVSANAFYRCSTIETVIVPEGVESIGDSAFSYSSIVSVDLPDSLRTLGAWTFAYCTALKEIDIPAVGTIERYTFNQCEALKSVTMQNGVNTIMSYAFTACSALQSLKLSNTLETIEQEAFKDCRKLKEVALPDSLTTLGRLAFSQCGGLVKVTFGRGLKAIDGFTFEGARKLAGLVIPANITTIDESAFKNAKAMTSLEIQGACEIGNSAFNGCVALKELKLTGTPSIGNSAFKQCSALEELVIDGDETIIGPSAFSQCHSLKKLVLNNVKSIGASAFEYSNTLETVILGKGIDSIGKKAFNSSGIKSITIAATLTTLQDNAFAECTKLDEVIVPASVKKLGGGAFQGFTETQKVTIPQSVLDQKGANNLWKSGCKAQVTII